MAVNLANVDNTTAQSFLSALAVNAGLLAIQVGAFVLLKEKLDRIYMPRTYLPPPDKRAPELPKGPWRWLLATLSAPMADIIHKNGLDAYMFLRFLKMLMWIFTLFTVVTGAIILPLNAAGVNNDLQGLDRFSWGNITGPGTQARYSAHIVLVYLLTFFVLYMIQREMKHFIHMRHQFLISKDHAHLAQARTVLITNVPEALADEHEMRIFANFVPGGVDKVWIYRDTKALNALFRERKHLCPTLEAATSNLLRRATLAWRAKQKSGKAEKAKPHHDAIADAEKGEADQDTQAMPPPTRQLLDELVPPALRPTHCVGTFGFLGIGKKVDTIDWCKIEISRLNKEIDEARAHIVKGKSLGSAFIRCNLQMGAHVLAQCVSYHEPLVMYDKWLDTNKKDIVWDNLDDGAVETRARYVLSWAATFGLLIVWAFPAAFVGTLSNINELCSKYPWLAKVCDAKKMVKGIVQGVLPPIILAVMFFILPEILRALAWYECIPRYSLISVSVYKRFFVFLLIHGFLIVTLTSTIVATIRRILQEPAQAVQELAIRLPKASTFFMTYMITQGLTGSGMALIQLVPLAFFVFRKWFMGRTPRQAYEVTFLMPAADFGIILPMFSLLATIGFAYSLISPIINVLAMISFFLFYVTWKFLFLHVLDQPHQSETGGLYFPMAIQNLFVGLYIEQVCLCCLFFLKVSTQRVSSIAEGVWMIVLTVITVFAQIFMYKSYAPIIRHLPMSLATKKAAQKYEKRLKRQTTRANAADLSDNDAEELDMFRVDRLKRIRRRLKLGKGRKAVKGDTVKAGVALATGAAVVGVANAVPPPPQHLPAPAATKTSTVAETAVSAPAVTESGVVTETTLAAPAPTGSDGKLTRQVSSASTKDSKDSKDSKKPEKSARREFAPAAAALSSDSSEDSGENDSTDDEHAFDHPSTYVDQVWIWIPRDPLGLSEVLVRELKDAGVGASDVGAVMDEKGEVEVNRNPPDEDWKGGMDQ